MAKLTTQGAMAPTPFAPRRGRPAQRPEAAGAQVQSLDRALTLLEKVAESAQGVALTDLAQAAGLAPSTAHRLLKSMQSRDFVRQDAERGLWFVGVRAFVVGNAFARARDITVLARPVMWELMEKVGESVNLAVLDDDEPVYLSQVECRQMMRAHALPGARAPVHCSGIGKALLAWLPSARVQAVLVRRGLRRYTEKTITEPARLAAELATVRARGYAIDDEEHSLGMRCVAAPVFDESGDAVAALSMTGPTARISDAALPELGVVVRAAAADLTARIGGRQPA
jgi:IclR family acetate operon transcriptional repressor